MTKAIKSEELLLFRSRLRGEKKRLGLTWEELAQEIGVSDTTLWRMRRKSYEVTLRRETVEKLEAYLGRPTLVEHVHRGYKYTKRVDDGWLCTECHRLATAETVRSKQRVEAGRADGLFTDQFQIDKLRSRVQILERRGYTRKVIAQETGITDLQLRKICRRGRLPAAIKQSTFDRFTAFWEVAQQKNAPAPAPRKDKVDAELSRLAVQGLQLRGWPGAWIAEQTGLATRSVNANARGEAKAVYHGTQVKLVELAQRYGTTDGPSPWTRSRAVKQGWRSTAERDELL